MRSIMHIDSGSIDTAVLTRERCTRGDFRNIVAAFCRTRKVKLSIYLGMRLLRMR